MQVSKYRQRLRSQIQQNYNFCQMLINQDNKLNINQNQLKYQEMIYLLLSGNVPISVISYFKNTQYQNDKQPSMRKQGIIEDAMKINSEVVTEPWKYDKLQKMHYKKINTVHQQHHVNHIKHKCITIDENIIGQRQTCDKQHHNNSNPASQIKSTSPSRFSTNISLPLQKQYPNSISHTSIQKKYSPTKIKNIISQLQQKLFNVQRKINYAHSQTQVFQYQKQYNRISKELTKVRNITMYQKQLQLITKIQRQQSTDTSLKLQSLLSKLKQLKQTNSCQLPKIINSNKISKIQQLHRFTLIFNHYCKQQLSKNNRYFINYYQPTNTISLQIFLKFIKQFQINRILTIQQIIHIFKNISKPNKSVTILQFIDILSNIHNHQCIKLQQQIPTQNPTKYFQYHVISSQKIHKILMNNNLPHKNKPPKLPNPQPISHSSQYLDDINKIISSKQQNIKWKIKKYQTNQNNTISKLSNNKIINNNHHRISGNPSKTNNIANNANKSHLNNNPTISSQKWEHSSLSKIGYDNNNNNNINSYAERYKIKNTKNKYKILGIVKTIYDKNNHQQQQHQQKLTIANLLNNNIFQKTQNNCQQLSSIKHLVQSQQDQYLNKHLFPPICHKKNMQTVHY